MQIDMHAATHEHMHACTHAHNPTATHADARTHAQACVGTRAHTNTCAASASSERQAHKPTRLVIMESAAGKVPVMAFEANALRTFAACACDTRPRASGCGVGSGMHVALSASHQWAPVRPNAYICKSAQARLRLSLTLFVCYSCARVRMAHERYRGPMCERLRQCWARARGGGAHSRVRAVNAVSHTGTVPPMKL